MEGQESSQLTMATWELLVAMLVSKVVDESVTKVKCEDNFGKDEVVRDGNYFWFDTSDIKRMIRDFLPVVPDGVRLTQVVGFLECLWLPLPWCHKDLTMSQDDTGTGLPRRGEVVSMTAVAPFKGRSGGKFWFVFLGRLCHDFLRDYASTLDLSRMGIVQCELITDVQCNLNSQPQQAQVRTLQSMSFLDFPKYFNVQKEADSGGNKFMHQEFDNDFYGGKHIENFQIRTWCAVSDNADYSDTSCYIQLPSLDGWHYVVNSSWSSLDEETTNFALITVSDVEVERLGLNNRY